MAHGDTYVFLFHDVSNSRTPYLSLLASKGYFQVIIKMFQSRLLLQRFVILSDLQRKFCCLRLRTASSFFVLPNLSFRGFEVEYASLNEQTRRMRHLPSNRLPVAPSERSCSRFHWGWTGWNCFGSCCRDERGRWTAPCVCCGLSSFGQPRACKTK